MNDTPRPETSGAPAGPEASAPDPIRTAAGSLRAASNVTALGLAAFGLTSALSLLAVGGYAALGPALVLLAFAAPAGWLAARVLQGFAAHLDGLAGQAEAADRVARRLASGLDRIAEAVEAARAAAPDGPPAGDPKAQRLAEIRHAIRHALWDEAAARLQALTDLRPDDPDAARLLGELSEAREAAGRELLAKVAAARDATDPERVIELRDVLKPLLDADALRALDRDLSKWFMTLIHRRLRTGTVRPDVAVLAARVAGSLDETPEGASLRASLPTLRRAAGLCARCGQPYAGVADTCPACLTGAAAVAAPFTPAAPDDEPDEETAPAFPPTDL